MTARYRGACCWLVLGAQLWAAGIAAAQTAGTAANRVGFTGSGLRGFERIHIPVAPAPEIGLAASAGYAFTESQGSAAAPPRSAGAAPPTASGAHHRALGALGVGAALRDWLGVGLRFDGRHDVHPDDGLGGDSSTVGDPRLLLRAGGAASDRVLLGGEAVLWVPGKDAPSLAFAASTLDLRATGALLPPASPWTFALSAGYRLDNSAEAAPDPNTLRPGDRLALGLSSFDAVLLALGVAHRAGKLELYGEASWDVLIGGGAPGASKSPLRLALGARVQLASALQLAFGLTASPSGRPEQGRSDRLVPIEPRLQLQAGLRYGFGSSAPKQDEATTAEPESAEQAKTAVPAAAALASSGPLAGRLLDAAGEPVAGARVTVRSSEQEQTATTDEQGRYAFDDVAFGPAELRAEREGYAGASWRVELGPDTGALPDQLLPRTAVGQLRGLALSFSGKPIAAQIRVLPVEPPDAKPLELRAGADGRFQLDLPPGRYQVDVAAPGFAGQTRSVTIEADGVVILNLDLRAGK